MPGCEYISGICVACSGFIPSYRPCKALTVLVKENHEGELVPDAAGSPAPLCRDCAAILVARMVAEGKTPPLIEPDAYGRHPDVLVQMKAAGL